MTILDFQARAAKRLADHDRRVRAPLERDLKRARRSIALLRATVSLERARARAAIDALESLSASASASGPGREWYTAIVAELTAKRALGAS